MERWESIEDFFSQLIDAPLEKRPALLDLLCGENLELRDELHSLLRSHDATNGPLDSPPQFIGDEELAGELLASGTVLGPWRIADLIGSGGAGDVYSALRADGAFEQQVAVKVLRREASTEVERFRSERQILARLDHPGMARLLDGGVCPDGRLYTVMEYVEGLPLDRYCSEKSATLHQRLDLFMQVCDVVAYAHRSLIVHRDLKPTNILIHANGRARLLDFGIAKLLAGDTSATGENVAPLTPEYAAPEQFTGSAITTATDIYSLGAVLFELLTGERPSRGANDTPRLASETARRNTASPTLAAVLQGDLDAIIGKCLRSAPNDRYDSAAELKLDIERYVRGEPVSARPVGPMRRALKLVARHKILSAATLVALTAIVAAAGIALWLAEVANRERDNALAFASRNEAVSEFLNILMTDSTVGGRSRTTAQLLERSEAFAKQQFAKNPDHQASVLMIIAANYRTLGDLERARPLLLRALELTKNSNDDSLRAELTCEQAALISKLGQVEQAKQLVNEVLPNPGVALLTKADCLQKLAYMAQDANDAPHALQYAKEGLELTRQSRYKSPIHEAALLGSIAYAFNLNGDADSADRYYASSISKYEEIGRGHSPSALTVKNNWALVSNATGDPKRALELFDEVLAIATESDPSANPPAFMLANRAAMLEFLGRYADAQSAYERSLTVARNAGNIVVAAYSLVGLASLARERGDLAAADKLLEQTMAMKLPDGSPPAIARQITRGRIALSRGQFAAAHTGFDAAIAGHERLASASFAYIGRSETSFAENDFSAAAADASQALSIAQALQKGRPFSNRTGLAYLALGRALEKQGKQHEAREAFQNAQRHLENTVDPLHPAAVMARQFAG